MGEYLAAVVIMSAILGLISCLSYPSGSEKTMKFAASVLLLYTAAMPILGLASKISSGDIGDYIGGIEAPDIDTGGEYSEVAENAFKEGISKLLFTEYGIKAENAEIYIVNFDFEKMRAEKILIFLSGSAVFADYRGIQSYITGLGLGECEVDIRLG